MFGVVLRVIGSKVKTKWSLAVFGQNHGLTSVDFRQNYKFAKSFCLSKRSRALIFWVVLRVIGSKVEAKCFLAVFGQKAWTNPSGFWSKFPTC